jgi:hypothetical protein
MGVNSGDEAASLSRIRTLAIGSFAGLAVVAAGAYYWLEIRGPWERRYCEAMIGISLQVPSSYRRIESGRHGHEWRIKYSALDLKGAPIDGRATCLISASEWQDQRMRPIMTQFMIDGGSVDTSRLEEPARRIAGAW